MNQGGESLLLGNGPRCTRIVCNGAERLAPDYVRRFGPDFISKAAALEGVPTISLPGSIGSAIMRAMRLLRAFTLSVVLASTFGVWSCGGNDMTSPSASCPNGPYTFDSNPSVNRCRASNGQFAANACCGH
jgi:hypothetical protein